MADFIKRLASAIITAGLILFVGYMCDAPIFQPDPSNFPAYTAALIIGGAVFVRSWRFA